jgi:hypothetical protein
MEGLNEAISKMGFAEPVDSGIGIHLTVYEFIEGFWIPELFLLSNFTGTSYNAVHSDGVRLSREMYHTIVEEESEPRPEHREVECRLEVQKRLHQRGRMLIFNNGDPLMFNAAANAITGMFQELARRRILSDPSRVETYLAIARRPIEVVANAQRDFCKEGARVVGGKPHELAVTPDGQYFSTTGDMPRAT